MVEPLPGGAIGLIGVTLVTVLAPWVLFSPAEMAKDGFKPANAALTWALSGFSNSTVWLIFGAFMFVETQAASAFACMPAAALTRNTLGEHLSPVIASENDTVVETRRLLRSPTWPTASVLAEFTVPVRKSTFSTWSSFSALSPIHI